MFPAADRTILGNIYVGQTETISKNIQAAFVLIQPGVRCYLPLAEAPSLLYASGRKGKGPLRPGDQILVQVSREAMKQKLPSLTSDLTFTGRYLVLTVNNRTLGVSRKLPDEERERWSAWVKQRGEGKEFGIVVRTNAAAVDEAVLDEELQTLEARLLKVTGQGPFRSVYSCLYKEESGVWQAVRDARGIDVIVTDLPDFYAELQEAGANGRRDADPAPSKMPSAELYEDELLPLYKRFRLEGAFQEALHEKVWLKSGGFLVIQQTEAFVSIDVNTGKCSGNKKMEETFRMVNLEAAREIARQLRLRNLSGTILIDFINMKNPDHEEELFHVMEKLLKKDPVKCKAVDFTALHIMEMTRKKVRRSLREELCSD